MSHLRRAAGESLRHALLLLILFCLGVAVLLPSCTTGRIDFYTCENPCYECEDPCAPCPVGKCVPLPALGWEGPVLLWFGSPDEEPECPAQAPAIVYEGYANPNWVNPCGRCACEPPSCILPGELAASATDSTCGAPLQTVDLPTNWDGSCRAVSPLTSPQSILAEGTGVTGCKPVLAEPPADDVVWMTKAKACATGKVLETCEDIGKLCAPPAGDTMPSARQCIFHRDAEVSCPGGYAQRVVFHDGLSDTISCSPCSCRSPEGSACQAEVRTYEDSSCTEAVHSQLVTLGVEVCEPPPSVPPQISSVDASFTVNLPGSCTPQGGLITNGGEPLRPSTFCCMYP